MNKRQFREWATSLTTVGFFVMGLTGIMLYFHIFNANVKLLHELLGLAFIIIVLGHVMVNWNAMKSYFNKRTFYTSVALMFIVTSGFIVQSLNQPPSGKAIILTSIMKAPLQDVFKVLKVDESEAKKVLEAKGFVVESNEHSLEEFAQKNNTSGFNIISLLKQ
ncbi:DUF4405 domain-containing protein [Candidatus Marinarcus aquaticus]|uniref:Flavinylation-associated cytochrome domain-containing protein n=1 Tax=Candidatus Marinarcus aquaticus TaxID=2044504 RepID=A0A4Q0XU18_9BACT|nr:DUF4405 domain-containing protein [Candidatus Marinarcus aquaticus]RXJ59994.1 hypothetical protein CRV04_02975 [Candidatus Marinarcus aquaticus]